MKAYVNTYESHILESELVGHADSELRRAGLFGEDSDYGGMLGKAVAELIEVFAKQGHSGFSAPLVIALFTKVASYDVLSPITSDESEWEDISSMCSGTPMWQNKRCPRFFSKDGGKTWYDVDAEKVQAVQEAMASIAASGHNMVFEEYTNGKEKQKWFTLKEPQYKYFYDMIYKHLPKDNQFAKDVLRTVKDKNYRISDRQYNYLKNVVDGNAKPTDYSRKN